MKIKNKKTSVFRCPFVCQLIRFVSFACTAAICSSVGSPGVHVTLMPSPSRPGNQVDMKMEHCLSGNGSLFCRIHIGEAKHFLHGSLPALPPMRTLCLPAQGRFQRHLAHGFGQIGASPEGNLSRITLNSSFSHMVAEGISPAMILQKIQSLIGILSLV